MEQLLPVGSIVRLKRLPEHRFMIMGYLQEIEGKVYDYLGTVYPTGLLDDKSCFGFQTDEIEDLEFMGYLDEDGKAFTVMIPKMMAAVRELAEQEESRREGKL